jgi:hypothetical protein
MTRRLLAPALALLLLAPAACRKTSETRAVLETVGTLARLAEQKDIETFMAAIGDDYSDFEGRDKAGLRSLLGGYFAGRTGIVVHRLGARVEFPEPARAGLQTDVALSSGAAEALRRLVKISPDLYRLEIELIRAPDRWLVRYAEWRAVGVTEVLPESLGPLKVLLPNLMLE